MNNVKDFGAVGDGIRNDTTAIQKAINGGGIVFFPPGTYLSGTLYLKSNGGIELAAGAVLLASPAPHDYNADDFCPQNRSSKVEKVSGAHFIVALEQRNITIQGAGRIDGHARHWINTLSTVPAIRENYECPDWRPSQMLFICECENVTITGVELYDAPYWSLLFLGCENVIASRLRIWTDPLGHNGDGIGIDASRQVVVSDCIIEGSDDCITLRNCSSRLKKKGNCEYVTISNCILSTNEAAIRIGVGDGLIRRAVISNLTVKRASYGICFCSRWGNDTGTTIREISFANIFMEAKRPFNITSDVRKPVTGVAGSISDCSFRHIRALAAHPSLVTALYGAKIHNISFHDVDISYDTEVDEWLWANGENATSTAFYLENAHDVSFERVNIMRPPNWEYGFRAVNCTGINVVSCSI
jgi:polygalacturonase